MKVESLFFALLSFVVAKKDPALRRQKREVEIVNQNLLGNYTNEDSPSGAQILKEISRHTTNKQLGIIKEASAELLETFGLEIPENLQEFRGHSKKPPKYMVDLYNEIADHNGISKFPDLLDADTVRSVPNNDPSCPLRCYFDLQHVLPNEIAVDAELHVFIEKPRLVKRKKVGYVIKIFQIFLNETDSKPWRTLVAARRLPIQAHGWQIFPLLHVIETWSSFENHGLVIDTSHDHWDDVTKQQRYNKQSKQPILVLFTRDGNRLKHGKQKRTIQQHKAKMAVIEKQSIFSDYKRTKRETDDRYLLPTSRQVAEHGSRGIEYRSKTTHAKDTNEIKLEERHLEELSRKNASLLDKMLINDDTMHFQSDSDAFGHDYVSDTDSSKFSSFSLSNAGSSSRSCRRYPLFVDFDQLGWSGWIIHPLGYNAYHCRGTCDFPLAQHLKPSNHANVQSIMHTLGLGGQPVEKPSCAPDELYDIHLLYFDRDEYVVLRRYEGMVAGSCTCR